MDMREILKRVDLRLSAEGLTDAAASRQATGSPDLIRNWRRAVKNGGNPGASTSTLTKLAEVLNTNLAWLAENIGDEDAGEPSTSTIRVPLLSWISAGALKETAVVDDMDLITYVSGLGLDPTGDWIALRVDGRSMDKISPHDSIVFVNRNEKSLVPNGLYIISDGDGGATYKRYRPPNVFEPVSTKAEQFSTILFHEGQPPEIIGRVRKTILDL